MEVDPPPLSAGIQKDSNSEEELPPLNPLKRSNSAPMINICLAAASTSPITVCVTTVTTVVSQNSPMSALCNATSTLSQSFPKHYERIRRYSTSSTSLHSPTTPVKGPSRLDQIKREESFNVKDQEIIHENKMQANLQMNLSWENLHLDETEPMLTDSAAGSSLRRPKSFQEPLHIFTSPLFPSSSSGGGFAGSPSPTRVTVVAGRQCFSPSLQQPVPAPRGLSGAGLTPSPSPSPTRKTFVHRRSMSPIALRPSPLGGAVKRKMDLDVDARMDTYHSSPKRLHMSPGSSSLPADKHHTFMHSDIMRSSSPIGHYVTCRSPLAFNNNNNNGSAHSTPGASPLHRQLSGGAPAASPRSDSPSLLHNGLMPSHMDTTSPPTCPPASSQLQKSAFSEASSRAAATRTSSSSIELPSSAPIRFTSSPAAARSGPLPSPVVPVATIAAATSGYSPHPAAAIFGASFRPVVVAPGDSENRRRSARDSMDSVATGNGDDSSETSATDITDSEGNVSGAGGGAVAGAAHSGEQYSDSSSGSGLTEHLVVEKANCITSSSSSAAMFKTTQV